MLPGHQITFKNALSTYHKVDFTVVDGTPLGSKTDCIPDISFNPRVCTSSSSKSFCTPKVVSKCLTNLEHENENLSNSNNFGPVAIDLPPSVRNLYTEERLVYSATYFAEIRHRNMTRKEVYDAAFTSISNNKFIEYASVEQGSRWKWECKVNKLMTQFEPMVSGNSKECHQINIKRLITIPPVLLAETDLFKFKESVDYLSNMHGKVDNIKS